MKIKLSDLQKAMDKLNQAGKTEAEVVLQAMSGALSIDALDGSVKCRVYAESLNKAPSQVTISESNLS